MLPTLRIHGRLVYLPTWILLFLFKVRVNTLPETNIAVENPPFRWYLPGNMGIFRGYVSFTEGNATNVPWICTCVVNKLSIELSFSGGGVCLVGEVLCSSSNNHGSPFPLQ